MSGPCFSLREVTVTRGAGTVLAVPDLRIRAGATTTVVGPSGAGKSTLLRLLAGLEPPARGTVTSCGPDGEPLRPGQVVMVFQRPALFRGTVAENAGVGLRLRGERNLLPQVLPWLERLGLAGKADRPVSTLSGGEFQRVALARALALQPHALLLDEPTANLDPDNVARIERVVAELQAETKLTVIWVTHNPIQARRVAHSALLLLDGTPVEHSDVETFFGVDAQPSTRDFLGGRLVW